AQTGSAVVVSPADEGGPLTNGAMETGTLEIGRASCRERTETSGDAIVVNMREVVSGSTLWPELRIYSPRGALLTGVHHYGAEAAEVATTAATGGTYLVVAGDFDIPVGPVGGVSGSSRLTLAQTGSAVVVSPADEGGPLTNGAMETGTLDVGDLDVWTLTATVGDTIVVTMEEVTSGSPLAPQLRIYSPAGGAALGS